MKFPQHSDTARALWALIEAAPLIRVHYFTAEVCRALLAWNDRNGDFSEMAGDDARDLLARVALANRPDPAASTIGDLCGNALDPRNTL